MVDRDDIAFAHKLADAAGEAIRPYFRRKIAVIDKGEAMFDPVTEADKLAEEVIRTLIKRERPADGILGEEYGEEAGTSGRVWVIDPIDGTRAFITGNTQWGTLIALNDGGAPVLGVLDQPILKERFVGRLGSEPGATLRSPDSTTPLAVRACAGLDKAVLMTTHPWNYFDTSEQEMFRRLTEKALLTRFGGDCYAYGLLAMGFVDLVVEARLKPWDIQALIPIVEGAGGIVTDWQGRPCFEGGRVIAAGDRAVHAAALEFLKG
jgi:myo-inositol-1(or 4)-monophosphatase